MKKYNKLLNVFILVLSFCFISCKNSFTDDSKKNSPTNESPEFTITYNLEDGEWVENYTPVVSFRATDTVSLPDKKTVMKQGFEFEGWFDDDNNLITEIPAGTQKDIVLYAKWLRTVLMSEAVDYFMDLKGENKENPYVIKIVNPEVSEFKKILELISQNEIYVDLIPTAFDADVFKTLFWDNDFDFNNDYITGISIPEGITELPDEAFYSWESLKNIIVPDTVIKIGDAAFCSCDGLENIKLSDNVEFIGYEAFSECESLKEITIPNSVKTLERRLFSYSSSLKKVILPESLERIEDYVFDSCEELELLVIPGSVTYVGEGCFTSCDKLEKITLPDSVTEIGEDAFAYCSNLKEIVISDGVTSLSNGLFKSCENLSSIKYGSNITSIGSECFSYCENLKSINIPAFVNSIGESAFANSGICEIVLDKNNESFIIKDNTLYSKNYDAIIYCIEKLNECLIPEGITRIPSTLYSGNSELKEVKLPSSIIEIGYEAFADCKNLTSIELNEGLEKIGYAAFRGCGSLVSVKIPSSVKEIDFGVFIDCENLEFIYVSEELASELCNQYPAVICVLPDGSYYYSEEKKYELRLIEFWKQYADASEIRIDYDIYKIYPDLQQLYIPAKTFANNTTLKAISIKPRLSYIGEEAFSGCSNLISFDFSGADDIKDKAFSNCINLEEIDISSVYNIQDDVFDGCENLKKIIVSDDIAKKFLPYNIPLYYPDGNPYVDFSVYQNEKIIVLPEGITRIPNEAFAYNKIIEELEIPESLNTIGDRVFLGCENLKTIKASKYIADLLRRRKEYNGKILLLNGEDYISIYDYASTEAEELVLPAYFTEIPDYCFQNNPYLKKIVIPEGVEQICCCAFRGCINLAEIKLPSTIKYIENGAFENCSSLEAIELPEGLEQISEKAFFGCENLKTIIASRTIADQLSKCGIKIPIKLPDGSLYIDIYEYNNLGLEEITLPSGITEIPFGCFEGNQTLRKIVIPEGVNKIGQQAFSRCSSLTEIVLPESIRKIDSFAFEYCSNLKSITLPEKLEQISTDSFFQCDKLDFITCTKEIADTICNSDQDYNITLLDGTKYVNFSKYYFREEVIITEEITEIPAECFSGYNSIRRIELPEGVVTIGDKAFYGCNQLEQIVIPSTVKKIGNSVFSNRCRPTIICNSSNIVLWLEWNYPDFVIQDSDGRIYDLRDETEIVVPSDITKITQSRFQNFEKLESVILPEGITEIEEYAFAGCTNLKTVNLPSSVEKIDNLAFEGCQSLDSFVIPETVTWIGTGVFDNCVNLTDVEIPGKLWNKKIFRNSDVYKDEELMYSCYVKNLTLTGEIYKLGKYTVNDTSFSGISSLEKVILPETIIEFGDNLFLNCKNLKEIKLPENLKTIKDSVFSGCGELEEIEIPTTVTKLGKSVFKDCRSLKKCNLPNGIKSIGKELFYNCQQLNGIIIPESVTSIGKNAFAGCSSLEKISCKIEFIDSFSSIKTEIKEVEIQYGATSIPQYTFSNWSSLSKIIIPSSVATIESHAFYYCEELKELIIPDGVLRMKDYSVINCYKLEKVILPKSLIFVSSCAFSDCPSIETVLYEGSEEQWNNMKSQPSFASCPVQSIVYNYIIDNN